MNEPIDPVLEADLAARSDPLRPIGSLRTPFSDVGTTPHQQWQAPDAVGALVVLDDYAPGLDGLAGFDWLHVIAVFDRVVGSDSATDSRARRPLLLGDDARARGVFTTRHPDRPNRLALSLIRVTGIEGRVVHFRGVDLADRTPIVDIKPFEARTDVPDHQAGTPWLDQIRSGLVHETGATERLLRADPTEM